MNLSTARSEKRAKEVGIRKAVGSVRRQLISQFFSESFLVVAFAFVLSLLLLQLFLPFFNELADKKIEILWSNPLFWLIGIGFCLFTGLIAGSYPALYLSSFEPIKVLKGTFRTGRFAAIPRKVLVVVQFTVSITLIIGTIVVYKQIQFAQNRPIGYSRNNLVNLTMFDPNFWGKQQITRNLLQNTDMVEEVSYSSNPLTAVYNSLGGFNWKGRDPNKDNDFNMCYVDYHYGKAVGWQIIVGRDFSMDFPTDSSAVIINETAAKYMHLKNPIGEFITNKKSPDKIKIIGVVTDLVMNSPYEPVKQTLFMFNKKGDVSFINIKIKPTASAKEALPKIEAVFKNIVPTAGFDYKFVDKEYAQKFSQEQRIGKLSTFFAILAIFISCLGLFGLASFVAEQRTKEIGVRKILGATVTNLWALLSKDFVILLIIALLIASPIAYYFMNNWVRKYTYHTDISWWIFAAAGAGTLVITLLTVSYQAIKAALMNPVKSLKAE